MEIKETDKRMKFIRDTYSVSLLLKMRDIAIENFFAFEDDDWLVIAREAVKRIDVLSNPFICLVCHP